MGRLLILEAIDGARVPTIKGTGNIDLVASCWFTAFDGIGKPNALLHFGFAVNDGSDTQGSWTWSSFHGELPGPDISFVTAVAGDSNVQVQNDDTSIHTTVVAEAFDAGGFTMNGTGEHVTRLVPRG